jgi:hypothetical protein
LAIYLSERSFRVGEAGQLMGFGDALFLEWESASANRVLERQTIRVVSAGDVWST